MVIFHKAVPFEDVPQFIAAADFGVVPLPDQPQWRYQTPTKLLEYLSMGKPVIVTDIPAHRWILGNSSLAFFCKQGRPSEIAEAIFQCLGDRRPVEEFDGKQIAETFSPDVLTDAVLDVFRHGLSVAAATRSLS